MPDGDRLSRRVRWRAAFNLIRGVQRVELVADRIQQHAVATLRKTGGLPSLCEAKDIIDDARIGRTTKSVALQRARALETRIGSSDVFLADVVRRHLAEPTSQPCDLHQLASATVERLIQVELIGSVELNLPEIGAESSDFSLEYLDSVRASAAETARTLGPAVAADPACATLRARAKRRRLSADEQMNEVIG